MIAYKHRPANVLGRSYPAYILTDLPWQEFVRMVLVDWARYSEREADVALKNYTDEPGESGLSTVGFCIVVIGLTERESVTLQRLGDGGVWIVKELTPKELEEMVEILNPEEASAENKPMLIWGLTLNILMTLVTFVVSGYYVFATFLSSLGEFTAVCLTDNSVTCYSLVTLIVSAAIASMAFAGFYMTSIYLWRRIRS